MPNEYNVLQDQITWLTAQIDCIKTGDCCGGTSFTPDLTLAGTILTSTFTDGTAVPVDLSSIVGINIYNSNGTIGTGRIAGITDTFDYINFSGGKKIHTFNNLGDIWFVQNNTAAVGIGFDYGIALPSTLNLKGGSFLQTEGIFRLVNNTDDVFYDLRDNGSLYTGLNTPAVDPGASVGQYHILTGAISTGVRYDISSSFEGFYVAGKDGTRVAFRVTALGALTSGTLGTAGNFVASQSGSEINIGVHSRAEEGSEGNIGVYGTIGSDSSVHAANDAVFNYDVGVKGLGHVDNGYAFPIAYGVEGLADLDDSTLIVGKRAVGVRGEARKSSFGASTNNALIGGEFLAGGAGTTTQKTIALLVPLTDNSGNVVIGADDHSVDKYMVEITGDLALMGIGNAIKIKSPNGTEWSFSPDNSGAWVAV